MDSNSIRATISLDGEKEDAANKSAVGYGNPVFPEVNLYVWVSNPVPNTMSRWSNWLTRNPFKVEIMGSNPIRDTTHFRSFMDLF